MPDPITASCSCGALTATVTGTPVSVAICSCEECQRRTGSAFGYSGYWDEADVAVAGASTAWTRGSARGRKLDFHFCPTCGATLWWRAEFFAGKIGIALGNFADGTLFAPTVAVWDKRRHRWLADLGALHSLAEGRF